MSKVLVLTVDFIKGMGQSSGVYAGLTKRIQNYEVLENANKVLFEARQKGHQVAHVKLAFRSKYPDISADSKVFSAVRQRGLFLQSDESSEFIDGLDVHPDDVIIEKKRVSPFYGTDLEVVIRSLGIQELWVMGITTVNGVQAAVRDAHDRDLRVKLFADATQSFSDSEQESVLAQLSKYCALQVCQKQPVSV